MKEVGNGGAADAAAYDADHGWGRVIWAWVGGLRLGGEWQTEEEDEEAENGEAD
jgi:hypothetical protein